MARRCAVRGRKGNIRNSLRRPGGTKGEVVTKNQKYPTKEERECLRRRSSPRLFRVVTFRCIVPLPRISEAFNKLWILSRGSAPSKKLITAKITNRKDRPPPPKRSWVARPESSKGVGRLFVHALRGLRACHPTPAQLVKPLYESRMKSAA